MAEKRACKGVTKAGKACRAYAIGGTDHCMAHSPKDLQEKVGFGGPQEGAGRPRLPKPSELAQRLVEQNVIAVLRPHFAALGVTLHDDGTCTYDPAAGAKVLHKESGEGGTTYATAIDDLAGQIAAAEKLLDRVYGKPKQAQEHSGPDGGPIPVEHTDKDAPWKALDDEQLQRLSDLARGVVPDGDG